MTRLASSMLLVVAACFTIGCGDVTGADSGSGVPRSKRLSDLDAADREQLCAYQTEVTNAPRTVECSNGSTVTLVGDAECQADFGRVKSECTVTVEQAEACIHANNADPCNFGGAACVPILMCIL